MNNGYFETFTKEIVADLKSKGLEAHYKSLSENEKSLFLISQYLKQIKEEVNYELGKLSHDEAIASMVVEFGFKKINLPKTHSNDKFSLMYRKDKELLCAINGEKSDMTITCVSPYLDKNVKFNHYGTFVESLTTGDLSTSLETNSKGTVSPNELPLLSSKEHSLFDEESFASFCGLTYEEAERYEATGVIHGVNFDEILEKERRYETAMQERKIEREKLIEERLAVLPESLKESISYESDTQKSFK